MSSNAKTVKSEDNTQDMLIRVMTVARLLTQSNSKKKHQSDAKSNEKKHSKENISCSQSVVTNRQRTMARKTKRITTIPGYVKYLRTSDEDVQAPERSQDGQRRDIDRLLIFYQDVQIWVSMWTTTQEHRLTGRITSRCFAMRAMASFRMCFPLHRIGLVAMTLKHCAPLTNSRRWVFACALLHTPISIQPMKMIDCI